MRNSADPRQDKFAISDEASRNTIYAASTLNQAYADLVHTMV
jgi:hypothetical protein